MRVGIEVGGTFTDLIQIQDGGISVVKVPSTPVAPDVGALNAVDSAAIRLKDVVDLVHGSTVATNAVLERKGARVGVLVTRGTRDLFTLQRHDRTSIYDLNYRKPEPIVQRNQIFEVEERIDAGGDTVHPLDVSRLRDQLRGFLDTGGFDAVAICLLNSYRDSANERRVAEIVNAIAPGIPTTCSVDVAGEFREYERASTTVLAAYVQPVIERYLGQLVETVNGRGFSGRFSIMQSNGGRMPAQAMARNAVSALYSGPAAGVVGATAVAQANGYGNIITLDMGGTSTDVSLVVDGKPQLAPQTQIDGLPVRTPVIDITTVGAGGGSIAWVDDGGLLRVGPQSAGADPGPACYGRGGTLPTVTDAHLIRGTLQARSFLGGKMAVDIDAARASFVELAQLTGLGVDNLADAVIRIAEANIVRAIQQVSTERGHDPRDFVLVPFGGAGSLHAARVAEELGIRTILVPENAGVLSAVGLLVSDYVHHRSRTQRVLVADDQIERVRSVLSDLRVQASEYLVSQGVTEDLVYEPVLEMRYVGQAFEVSVALEDALDGLNMEDIRSRFAEAHHRVFEFSKPPDKAVEIVTFRIGVRARTGGVPGSVGARDHVEGLDGANRIDMSEGAERFSCQVATRTQLSSTPGSGPILIEDGTSTIYVPGGWQVLRDNANHLVMTMED